MSFKKGDKVTWMHRDTVIPHPKGKTDYEGNVLPMIGDKQVKGTVVYPLSRNRYMVRPDWADNYAGKRCGVHYYDRPIEGVELSLV